MILKKKYIFIFILFIFLLSVFFSFNYKVNSNQLWFANSDQNTWIIFSTLDFNDGYPSKLLTHPGIGSSLLYGAGYKFMKKLGLTEIDRSSDFINKKDSARYLPEVYHIGTYISMILVLLCGLLMFGIALLTTSSQDILLPSFAFISTITSAGFLFHSTMLRNELPTTYYFLLAVFFFCLSIFSKNELIKSKTAFIMVISGFFFGISYFSKVQIVVSIVLLILFYLFLSERKNYTFILGRKTSLSFSITLLGILVYLIGFAPVKLTAYWDLVFAIMGIFSFGTLINEFVFKKKNQIASFFYLCTTISLGFLLGMFYIFTRGLHNDAKDVETALRVTSVFDSGLQSNLDNSFTNIYIRFFYFMEHYFLESLAFFTIVFLVYLFFQKRKSWLLFLVALIFIIVLCFFNSLRIMFVMNLGRSVYKYMIFVDVFIVFMITMCYSSCLRFFRKPVLIHTVFWILMAMTGIKNYYKVYEDTNWTWTTYADNVFPERWLFYGKKPALQKILQKQYLGFTNGHDRVIFGNEILRGEGIKIPRGVNHLKQIHKRSLVYFLAVLNKKIPLSESTKTKIERMENELFDLKIELFERGFDYESIIMQISNKRKTDYKNILGEESFKEFQLLLNKNELRVAF